MAHGYSKLQYANKSRSNERQKSHTKVVGESLAIHSMRFHGIQLLVLYTSNG
jgi:hypothetical protein